MYLAHFGLMAPPFRLAPDVGFLFMSEAHRRAKSYMDFTVWNREGFVVVTGEIGCGKTTLLQKLLAELDDSFVVAKVFQTQLDEVEFLQALLVELGMNPFNAKKVELLDMLNTFAIEQYLQGKRVVLIVDDAHNLSLKVLEELRMLAGLEARSEKILHVILAGQPQLRDNLDHPEMEQLAQRVKLRYHIRALNEEELGEYVRYRLQVAGSTNVELFARDTFPVIYRYTGGVPRLINALCDTALTCAYADRLAAVTPDVIATAISELQWVPFEARMAKRKALMARAPEGGVSAMLRQQVDALNRISQDSGHLESLSPALTSIRKLLTAIEVHLREIANGPGARLHGGSGAGDRDKPN